MAFSLVDEINTNHVPTRQEARAIGKLLAGAVERLCCLDDEAIQLQTRLDNLTSRLECLSKDLEAHRCLLSPTRRLLPEILQEIFCHCLPTAHNSVMSSREAPLILGRVCSHWRQVAFSTPRLWASIHIVIPSWLDPPRSSEALRHQAISAWLVRSGALPLSISITSPRGWPMDPTVAINAKLQLYLDLVSPFTSRWKSIHFEFHQFDWTVFFNRYNASDLPWLETFHVSGDQLLELLHGYVSLDLVAPARENGVLLAPRLRVLSMPNYRTQILQFRIKWNNITGLNLSCLAEPLEDVIRALQLCPNLKFCSLAMPDPGAATVINPHNLMKIVLPKLHSLRLIDRALTGEYAARLTASLYTPELRHLTYERIHLWPASSEQELSSHDQRLADSLTLFFSRLINPLRELDLYAYSLSGKSVMKILSLLPGLKRLSIRSHGRPDPNPRYPPFPFPLQLFLFKDQPLTMLTPQDISNANNIDRSPDADADDMGLPLAPGSCLCPELEIFHCTGAMFSQAKMIEFLHSRSINHQMFRITHLRHVSVSFVSGRERSEETMDHINVLQRETGMVVDIYYPPSYDLLAVKAADYSPYDGLERNQESPDYFGF